MKELLSITSKVFFLSLSIILLKVGPAHGQERAESDQELNVTIIYTEGGGGHKAAMLAFEEALKNYPGKPPHLKVRFEKVDPPQSTLAGQFGNNLWETCFERGDYQVLAPGSLSMGLIQSTVFPALVVADELGKVKDIKKLIFPDLLPMESLIMAKGRPDLIISVFNGGNAQFLAVARKHNIPFRIGLTDYKVDPFIEGIARSGQKYTREQLEVYIPSDAVTEIKKLEERDIPYVITGYPINPKMSQLAKNLREKRPETIKSIRDLLDLYIVDADDSVIFVMMGAKGFDKDPTMKYIEAMKKHARMLHKDGKKLHVFLAAGLNDELRSFGRNMALENDTDFTIHALDNLRPDQVASFMGIYQVGNPFLLFTKPGGSTTGQAEAMGTPTIYSLNPIEHERFNAELMKQKNFADTIDMAHRAQTFHPQKAMALTSAGIDFQLKNAGRVADQVYRQLPDPIKAVGSFWPFANVQNALSQTAQTIHNSVAPKVEQVNRALIDSLPPVLTNQNVVDEAGLVTTLRKYLVEGEKFSPPPANQFADIVAPIIYKDLQRIMESRNLTQEENQ